MDVLGVVTTLAVAPPAALHLSVGGAAASIGINIVMMLSFTMLTWWSVGELDEDRLDVPQHAPNPHASAFPLPQFLKDAGYEKTINIGVVGMTGSGKSSLVNALRRKKPSDYDAAPVGVKETTSKPEWYSLLEGPPADEKTATNRAVRLWDLPGAGTEAFPGDRCVRDMGLRYFDIVVLVISGRPTETDRRVANELEVFKVPHVVVRSQMDADVENEAEDYGYDSSEVSRMVRDDMSKQGFPSIFLVSSRHPSDFDFHQLVASIVASVQAKRRRMQQDSCPICFESLKDGERKTCSCHWCCNVVCSECAAQLQGKLEETPCPFCRRWTSLNPTKDASNPPPAASASFWS